MSAKEGSGAFMVFGHNLSMRDLALAVYGVHWLRQHAVFSGMASTVGQYAAKTVLHRLSDSHRMMIEGALKRVGIDVESVSALQLGEQAVELAVPALVDEYLRDGPPAFMAGNAAMHIIQRLLAQIKEIAHMPARNDAGHRRLAALLHEKKTRPVSMDEIKRVATEVYGKGAHWLALALPAMQSMASDFVHSEVDAIYGMLRTQYAYWHEWAVRFQNECVHTEEDMLHFVQKMTEGWTHRPESPGQTGLFVASAKRMPDPVTTSIGPASSIKTSGGAPQ